MEYPIENEINMLDYIEVIARHRRMIFRLCGGAVIAAAIVSFILPKKYSAATLIMSPKTTGGNISDFAAKLGGISPMAGGMLGIEEPAEIYVAMLKSRTVADAIIQRFGLLKIYDVDLMKEGRAELRDNTDIQTDKASNVSITVEDTDINRAADIANAYVEELDKLNRRINVSDASRQRIFLERRLAETKAVLGSTEKKLQQFQEENKIVALDEQARATISGAAKIKGEIIATETELESMKGFATAKKNQIIMLNQKLEELKKQLSKIEQGEDIKADSRGKKPDEPNFYIAFTQTPALGLELARLMREVKIHETVFNLLVQQYEMAKIAEAKDTPTIQVIDKAVTPEKKSKPKRGLIIVLSGISTLIFSIIGAFIYECFAQMGDTEKERWQMLLSEQK